MLYIYTYFMAGGVGYIRVVAPNMNKAEAYIQQKGLDGVPLIRATSSINPGDDTARLWTDGMVIL